MTKIEVEIYIGLSDKTWYILKREYTYQTSPTVIEIEFDINTDKALTELENVEFWGMYNWKILT